jgi:hypothetical protein
MTHVIGQMISLRNAYVLRSLRAIQEMYIEDYLGAIWRVWVRVGSDFRERDLTDHPIFLIGVTPRGRMTIRGQLSPDPGSFSSHRHKGTEWMPFSFQVTTAPAGMYSEIKFLGPANRWSNLRYLRLSPLLCKLQIWNSYFSPQVCEQRASLSP